MDDAIAAVDRLRQHRAVPNVTDDLLVRKLVYALGVARRSHQAANGVARGHQLANHDRTDEAVASGYKDAHSASATTWTVCSICSPVWLAVMKNRSLAACSSTAGYTIGCTFMPCLYSASERRKARTESPTMTGTTAEPP